MSGYLHSQANTNQSPWLLPSSVTSADPEKENARGTALWRPISKCNTGQGNSQWLSNCPNPNVCLKKGSVHVTHISEWQLSMIYWCSVTSVSSSFSRRPHPSRSILRLQPLQTQYFLLLILTSYNCYHHTLESDSDNLMHKMPGCIILRVVNKSGGWIEEGSQVCYIQCAVLTEHAAVKFCSAMSYVGWRRDLIR